MDKKKAVIFVTPSIGHYNDAGQVLLENVNVEHCNQMEIPFNVQFDKNCESFTEAMAIIKDKMIKIQEILNEWRILCR